MNIRCLNTIMPRRRTLKNLGNTYIITKTLLPMVSGHRRPLPPHFAALGTSSISNLILGPFSISVPSSRGYSSIFAMLFIVLFFCTSLGKVDLLGVNAVATLRAELRSFLRTSHDRFFARYQRTEEPTMKGSGSVEVLERNWLGRGRTYCRKYKRLQSPQ